MHVPRLPARPGKRGHFDLMINRRYFVLAQLVCCGVGVFLLLLPGCATAGRKPKPAHEVPATSKPESKAAVRRSNDDDVLNRRIEAEAHYAAGVVHELRGENDLATEQFWLSAKNDPQNEPLVIELAQRLLATKKPDKAVPLLEAAAALPSASGLIDAWYGMALKEAGKIEPAVAAFRRAIRKSPQVLLGYHGLAQLYIEQKKPEEALKVFDSAAELPNATPGFMVDLAGLLAVASRTKAIDPDLGKSRALKLLERAAQAEPSEPFVLQKMADAYKTLGELGRAANLYLDLLQKYPPENKLLRRILREQLVRLYVVAGEKEKAAEQLNEFLKEDSTNPETYYLLGAIAAEEKNYDKAAEYYEKTILLNEDFEPAYHDLAGVRLSRGQPEAALEILARARTRFQRSFLVEFYTGLAQAALKQYREALGSFTDAELLAKTSEPARLNHLFYAQVASVHAGLAEQALRNKNDAEAEQHFAEAESLLRKSLEMAPDNADLFLHAGSIYERMARYANTAKRTEAANKFYAEADRYLRRCIELEPENAEALNYLGYMWAERGVNLEEARSLIERALKVEPGNAAFLDSLAWVLFKLGNAEAALKPMLEAIAKSEKPDATLFDHLGDIYSALNRHSEAREAWNQSLQVEDNPEVRRKLESAPSR